MQALHVAHAGVGDLSDTDFLKAYYTPPCWISNWNVILQFNLFLYKYSYTDIPAKPLVKKEEITVGIFGVHMHTWNLTY